MQPEPDQIGHGRNSHDSLECIFQGALTRSYDITQISYMEMIANMRQGVVLDGLDHAAVSLPFALAAGDIDVLGFTQRGDKRFKELDLGGHPDFRPFIEQGRLPCGGIDQPLAPVEQLAHPFAVDFQCFQAAW